MKLILNNNFKNSRYLKKQLFLNFILKNNKFFSFFQINHISQSTFSEFKKILLQSNLQVFFCKKNQIVLTSFSKLSKSSTFLVYSRENFKFQLLNNSFFDFLIRHEFTFIPLCFFFNKRFMFLKHIMHLKRNCCNNTVHVQLFYLLKFFIFRLINIITYVK